MGDRQSDDVLGLLRGSGLGGAGDDETSPRARHGDLRHPYSAGPCGGRERAWGGAKGEFAINLRADLAEIYPELTDVPLSHTWFGFVAYNLDYLPRLFERDSVHYATGFCGSGVVWAWWIASKLAFKLIGDAKAETAFAGAPPSAVPFYTGTPWFLPAALLWYGLQDHFGAMSKKTDVPGNTRIRARRPNRSPGEVLGGGPPPSLEETPTPRKQ